MDECAEEIVQIIFDKAIEEKKFCAIYSDICSDQVHYDLQTNQNKSEFRSALLKRCQHVFEDEETKDEALTRLATDIKAAKEAGERAKADEMSERMLRLRQRVFGNIRFIGELYKRGLIVRSIVNYCFTHLLARNKNHIQKQEQAKAGTAKPASKSKIDEGGGRGVRAPARQRGLPAAGGHNHAA